MLSLFLAKLHNRQAMLSDVQRFAESATLFLVSVS